MTSPISTNNQSSQFLIYSTNDDKVKVDVFIHNENIWLTQTKMAQLFDVSNSSISEHLTNIYKEGELDIETTLRKFGNSENSFVKPTNYYNLDAIISVGYRVNSAQATQFRIWATTQLRELIIKGFVLNDEMLKQGQDNFGKDYFRELLERIRSIRASERRIWFQITDIFAECSSDYNPKSPEAIDFFATVQNKFHFAIAGHTAAELIHNNADHTQPKMGLKTYKNSPDGRVLKNDVSTAKNYLEETEIKKLERTVTSFFDYIEGIVERKNNFDMKQFIESVDKFLSFNEYKILDGKGGVSHESAKTKAEAQYDIYNKTQIINSDFEKASKKILTRKSNDPR